MKRKSANEPANYTKFGTAIQVDNTLNHNWLRLSIVATKRGNVLQNLLAAYLPLSTRPGNSGPEFGIHPLVTKVGDLEGDILLTVAGKALDKPADVYRCEPGEVITATLVWAPACREVANGWFRNSGPSHEAKSLRAMKLPKFKIITQQGRVFLFRFSFPFSGGSIKLHLIVNDDSGPEHRHPWRFSSFLLFGAYREQVDGKIVNHWPLRLVQYELTKEHKVILYRFFGIKLPCLTVGRYTEKVQPWCRAKSLCDRCKPLGVCVDAKFWMDHS
jgi:hypothetical protein